jgi:hypothetical protein
MKIAMLRVIVMAVLAFGFAGVISAKEWRGLMPLRSTRANVEKLLGEPTPAPKDGTRSHTLNKAVSIYFVDEGEVYIVFAVGTVLMIQITPKTKRSIAEFITDEKKYRKFDPSDRPNLEYEAYINEEDGKVVAIDGGYRESFTVQLFIAPQDFAPPIPDSTVDPSQVKIVFEKKRRSRN